MRAIKNSTSFIKTWLNKIYLPKRNLNPIPKLFNRLEFRFTFAEKLLAFRSGTDGGKLPATVLTLV
jgi:hypothetical protein